MPPPISAPSVPPSRPPTLPPTLRPAPKTRRKPRVETVVLVRAGLGVLVVALTVVALAVESNGQRGYDAWTTWAVFATVVAAAHLLPLVWRNHPQPLWDTVAIATGGLAFYWVAIVLPFIGSATSFAQTLAVALAVAHCWLLPGRR